MANVDATLRTALGELEAERNRIDRQIAALKAALGETGRRRKKPGRPAVPSGQKTTRKRRRRKFTAAQRKEVSQRMKAYWAKRKAGK